MIHNSQFIISMLKLSFYILIACLFTACSSVNYIGIETYNPAEITFPKDVRRILIVNNALPQPHDVGYQYKLYGTVQDTARAQADSALFDACKSLGKAIADIPFFEDVLLYDGSARKDNRYLVAEELSLDDINMLCEATGTDAIISFDRLLFDMNKNVVAFAEGYVGGEIDARISGVVRSYIPGRARPLATVHVKDSLFWHETADNMELLKYYLPSSTEALRAAGHYIGEKVMPTFVPHWENEMRWYYSGVASTWKEASAYASTQKWEEAAKRWRTLYTNSSGWRDRAKAASNLALYYEMGSKLNEAYEWATKSYDLFEKQKGANDKNTQIQKLYRDALQGRLQSDVKLKMQIDEE